MSGVNVGDVREVIGHLLEKNGIDEQKWKDDLNNKDKEIRTINLNFDTETTKDGFKLKVYYNVTKVKIDITCPETLKEIEEGNME